MEYCTLKALKKIGESIAEHFGENCEVLIHDIKSDGHDSRIVYIKNGHVSGRHLGDGPSRIILESSQKKLSKIKDNLCYLTKTKDGKILKSSTLFFSDKTKKRLKYVLSINYDITHLLVVDAAIQTIISTGKDKNKEAIEIPNNVNDLLESLIEKSVELIGKPAPLMTKIEKKKAIKYLNEAGVFLITKSGDRISQYFGISKYTLYSYIDIKNTEKDNKKIISKKEIV